MSVCIRIEFCQHVLGARTKQEFIYSERDIGTYPIDIELLVDREPSEDGSQGPYGARKVIYLVSGLGFRAGLLLTPDACRLAPAPLLLIPCCLMPI
jgi:hypothetical protein